MTHRLLLVSILMMSAIYIFLIPQHPIGFKIFMKLIPMLLIILNASLMRPLFSRTYKKIILGGLFVCMVADGVIYWFLAGLATFFAGHLFYIAAFRHVQRKEMPVWAAVPLLLYGACFTVWIAGSQWQAGHTGLAIAILAYIAVILTMGWMAVRTGLKLAILGALLFILSDSILAIDRFIEAVPYRDFLVMGTYYAAQLSIAASIGSRVVKYSVKQKNLIR